MNLDQIKNNNEEFKGIKFIVSDSDHSLSAFKILTNQDSDMELRLYSYDTFYHMFNQTLVSRYNEDVEQEINNPEEYSFLKTGTSQAINWTISSEESSQSVEDFLSKSLQTIDQGISQGKVDKESVFLESTTSDPKYKDSWVQALDSKNYKAALENSKRYSVIKVYSHLWRGWKFIEKAYEKLAEKNPKIKFYELHTATEGVPLINDIRKTPSIIVYDRKKKTFETVELNYQDFNKAQKSNKDEDEELLLNKKMDILEKILNKHIQ